MPLSFENNMRHAVADVLLYFADCRDEAVTSESECSRMRDVSHLERVTKRGTTGYERGVTSFRIPSIISRLPPKTVCARHSRVWAQRSEVRTLICLVN